LKFFADHCVPESVCVSLEKSGHEVLRLRAHLATESTDQIVIRKAQDLGCVLLSVNGDFAHIINYPPAEYGGIIAVQLKNDPALFSDLLKHLEKAIVGKLQNELSGKLLIVSATSIRVRG
jgi:predicted nuclease of predicted toxin-antitoxin system